MKTLLLIPAADVAVENVAKSLADTLGAALVQPFLGEKESDLAKAVAAGELDVLLEEITAAQAGELSVVQGVAASSKTPFANHVNHALANALDADVIYVVQDDSDLAVYAAEFGGTKAARSFGAIAVGAVTTGDDFVKVATVDAAGNLSDVNTAALDAYKAAERVQKLSPYAFRNQVVKKAQAAKKRIVLPEGDEPRTIEAAAICQSRGIAQCVLLAKPEDVARVAAERGVTLPSDIEIIDPQAIFEKYIDAMVERRKGKTSAEQAHAQLQDSVVLGTMMLQLDEVDGLVSGAVHTTADTIRPAFQLIKTAPQYSLVSSVFFMLLPEQVVVYGDCAVNPNPTAEQLAEIALQSAESAKAFGIDPKVAMISYSTGNSGMGEDVETVKAAVQIIREKDATLKVDGPLQFDAASVPSVGKQKAPNSPVAGEANVFIFPDLNTGNTTYKAVQRTANVISVGPMLQGLNKPVNDLSRGALVEDIVYTIALTAIQAIGA